VIRFCCYSLVAIVALIGPRWMGLVGEVSASFRATTLERKELTLDNTESSPSTGTTESRSMPSDPIPSNPKLQLGFNMPANGGAGSATFSGHSGSPNATSAVMSEVVSPPIPFVTLLRIAEDRIATISSPASVFEPPRTSGT
jgi:hypothetical protein